MKIFKLFASVSILLLFASCANQGLSEVSPNATNQVLYYQKGVITSIKPVAIKDSGTGSFIGGLVGAVLGSTIGRGRGSVLASLGGGLAGAYVGSEVGKANAQELTIRLDDTGDNIVVIVKGLKHHVGERVRIVKNGSRVTSVEAY